MRAQLVIEYLNGDKEEIFTSNFRNAGITSEMLAALHRGDEEEDAG